ncbi:MAG: serine hydrolase domain-containing protein [Bacteroidia bacterium]
MSSLFQVLLAVLIATSGVSCRRSTEVSTIPELEAELEREVSKKHLTSISYCVVNGDEVLYSNAQGLADEDNNRASTDSTRYLIASISKTITAVALMQLVDQNLIALDDDVNAQLPFSLRNPDFPNDPITYRMLLSHTSSISDNHQNTLDLYCYGSDCTMSLEDYFDNVFVSGGAYFSSDNFSGEQPGAKEDYSNLGFALLGYLVERIAQVPFDQYCEDHIFTPLGMRHTEWRLANTDLSQLAIPYSNDIPDPNNPHYTFPDYPNGGLRTTVLDMSRFLRAVMRDGTFGGQTILTPASMAEMKKLQFGSSEQCLGFYFNTLDGRDLLGHSGGEMGVTTEMFYDPSTNIGAIVFNNDDDANLDRVMSLLLSYGENQ